MATGAPQKSQNRQGSSTGYSGGANSVDVGLSTVTQMARDDTRWFVVGVVVLSLVIMLALPITVLLIIDDLKMKSEIKYEIKQMRKLKKELEEIKESK